MPPMTRARGYLERRLRLGLDHLVRERGRLLRGEGPTQGWGADGLGRWIGAVAMAADVLGEGVPELPGVAAALLAHQLPDGGFTATRTGETWWGTSRALIGLLEAWSFSRDPSLLDAARRLGDHYLRVRPGDLSGFAGPFYGAAMEGLVALADATGAPAYLELAAGMVGTAEGGFGLRCNEGPERHTHTFLSAVRGSVLVHEATGVVRPLAAAVECWERIAPVAMWVTGGVSEGSRYPFESTDETCAVADWFRLSLQLWRATREPRFLDAAELTLLNHLLFDQDQSGGFCYTRSISAEPVWGIRDIVAWWCCSMHGVRALAEAARGALAVYDGGIDVALCLPVETELTPVAGVPVRVAMSGAYPVGIRIAVDPACSAEFPIRVRVPTWSDRTTVSVNGRPVAARPDPSPAGNAAAAAMATLRRRWQGGDVIELSFEPRFRVIPAGTNGFPSVAGAHPAAVHPAAVRPAATPEPASGSCLPDAAIAWGPLVLMVDPSLNHQDLRQAKGFELAVPWDGRHRTPVLAAVDEPPGSGEAPFPNACFAVLARDLSNSDQPVDASEASWKLAYLVPVAEVTGRWSPSNSRMVPYEVRNQLRLVDTGPGAWRDQLDAQRKEHAARTAGGTIVTG